jgi:hypothetical protein
VKRAWLFSSRIDLAVFGGSALFSFLLLAIGARLGLLDSDAPEWAWVAGVLLVDVAHVWSTIFRTYLDGSELRTRPVLYTVVPIAAYVLGFALYDTSSILFWRCLAYLAIFHFVRQQYGWVALYRKKAGETSGRAIDVAAIYAATLYPLLWWHAHLPRKFSWFIANDFPFRVSNAVAAVAAPVYVAILMLYAARTIRLRFPNPGKDVVVVTTALCWYVGIVALNSDFAFTVTNVFIHGIPYLALVYLHQRERGDRSSISGRLLRFGFPAMVLILWVIAFAEEALWDASLWHDRAWLFGSWSLASVERWLVPLLAVPQVPHYVLDGFIWKRRYFEAKQSQPIYVASANADALI